jgi:hypothetical protein
MQATPCPQLPVPLAPPITFTDSQGVDHTVTVVVECLNDLTMDHQNCTGAAVSLQLFHMMLADGTSFDDQLAFVTWLNGNAFAFYDKLHAANTAAPTITLVHPLPSTDNLWACINDKLNISNGEQFSMLMAPDPGTTPPTPGITPCYYMMVATQDGNTMSDATIDWVAHSQA